MLVRRNVRRSSRFLLGRRLKYLDGIRRALLETEERLHRNTSGALTATAFVLGLSALLAGHANEPLQGGQQMQQGLELLERSSNLSQLRKVLSALRYAQARFFLPRHVHAHGSLGVALAASKPASTPVSRTERRLESTQVGHTDRSPPTG